MRLFLYLGKFIVINGIAFFVSGVVGYAGPLQFFWAYNGNEQRVQCIIIGLFLWVIGKLVIREVNQSEQKRRNINAQLISEDNGRGEFVLYLRPFTSTGRILVMNPFFYKVNYGFLGHADENLTIDFENLLVRRNKSKVELIAIGGAADDLGAGKIQTSNEDWFIKFKQLAICAKFIIVLPSYHSGTYSELEWLHSMNLLSKIVFVRPFIGTVIDGLKIREYWKRTQDTVSTIGFQLPEYDKGGGFFIYDGERFKVILKSVSGLSFPKTYKIVKENIDNYNTLSKAEIGKLGIENRAVKMGICSICRTYVLSTSYGKCPSCRNDFSVY